VAPETVLAAYLDETADIPLAWMREIAGIYRGSGLEWLPSLPKLRFTIATRIRWLRREELGQSHHSVTSEAPINTEGILRWAAEKVPNGYAQLAAICAPDRDRLAIEAKNVAAVQADADLSPQQQRSELTRLTLEGIEKMIEADGLTPQLERRQLERAKQARRRVG